MIPDKIESTKDYTVVAWPTKLEAIQDCIYLSRKVNELFRQRCKYVVLDLSKSTSITASFCGFLVVMAKHAREKNARFAVVLSRQGNAFEILDIFLIQHIVDIYFSFKELEQDQKYESTIRAIQQNK